MSRPLLDCTRSRRVSWVIDLASMNSYIQILLQLYTLYTRCR